MPYDDHPSSMTRSSLGEAIASLMSDANLCADEAKLRAALRSAVNSARDPVSDLWDSYRGGRP